MLTSIMRQKEPSKERGIRDMWVEFIVSKMPEVWFNGYENFHYPWTLVPKRDKGEQ